MQKSTQCNKILTALKESPNGITSRDLINMNVFKYSSRISELRQAGHNVVAHRVKKSLWRYTLEDYHKPEMSVNEANAFPETLALEQGSLL